MRRCSLVLTIGLLLAAATSAGERESSERDSPIPTPQEMREAKGAERLVLRAAFGRPSTNKAPSLERLEKARQWEAKRRRKGEHE